MMPYFPATVHPIVFENKVYNASCYNFGFMFYSNEELIFNVLFPNMEQYYFHDFAITENYYVFYLNPISLNVFNMYFTESTILENINFVKGKRILMVSKKDLTKTYINMPSDLDYPSLHIAKVTETPMRLEMIVPLLCTDFTLNKTSVTDMSYCFLHKISINLKTKGMFCEKVSDNAGDMPVVVSKYIFTINRDTLNRYDTKTEKSMKLKFDCVIEEPVVYEDSIFVIGHYLDYTVMFVLDVHTLDTIKSFQLNSSISFGFHGLFIPT
jgi:carotenoid cleavage dioxygenase-like enzyme